MTDREKLIELIKDVHTSWNTDKIADYLISKGVSIPVAEKLLALAEDVLLRWQLEKVCSYGEGRECAESFSNTRSYH